MTEDPTAASELRTYTILPGRTGDVMRLFREHLVRLLGEHGMTGVAYFTPDDDADRLVYLVAHDRAEDVQRNWDAFHADPRWAEAIEEIERGTRLVTSIGSVVMSPTDFSPLQTRASAGRPAQAAREARNRETALRFLDEFFN